MTVAYFQTALLNTDVEEVGHGTAECWQAVVEGQEPG